MKIVNLLYIAIWFFVGCGWDTIEKTQEAQGKGDAQAVRAALRNYQTEYGKLPSGTTAEICAALCGANPRKIAFIYRPPANVVATNGGLLDPWGTAYRIEISGTNVQIRSAGPNRRFDDGRFTDDIYAK